MWRLLKVHQVTNLKHRECECSLCLTGSAHLEALRELAGQLHERCTAVRSSGQQPDAAAGERVYQNLLPAAAFKQALSCFVSLVLHNIDRTCGCMRCLHCVRTC